MKIFNVVGATIRCKRMGKREEKVHGDYTARRKA